MKKDDLMAFKKEFELAIAGDFERIIQIHTSEFLSCPDCGLFPKLYQRPIYSIEENGHLVSHCYMQCCKCKTGATGVDWMRDKDFDEVIEEAIQSWNFGAKQRRRYLENNNEKGNE